MIVLTIPIGMLLLFDASVSQAQIDRLKKPRSLTPPPAETPMVEIPAGEFVMGSDYCRT